MNGAPAPLAIPEYDYEVVITPFTLVFTKKRRHHNNKGFRQIKRGKTKEQIKRIAQKLRIPYQ